jgi:hypothetical protein
MSLYSFFEVICATYIKTVFAFQAIDVMHDISISAAKVAFADLLADFITPKVCYCGPKAEGRRFELLVGCPTHAFQACALDRYANPPCVWHLIV